MTDPDPERILDAMNDLDPKKRCLCGHTREQHTWTHVIGISTVQSLGCGEVDCPCATRQFMPHDWNPWWRADGNSDPA